jgi:Lon protease-like protein
MWARFLEQAQGYIATEVEGEGGGRFRVRDFWSWHRGFEVFRERYSEDFARFDREILEEFVEKQEFLGAYYEAAADE